MQKDDPDEVGSAGSGGNYLMPPIKQGGKLGSGGIQKSPLKPANMGSILDVGSANLLVPGVQRSSPVKKIPSNHKFSDASGGLMPVQRRSSAMSGGSAVRTRILQ
jgi:hypothetical protein